MTNMLFTWDDAKNTTNKRKHSGVSFEEAQGVFFDEQAIEFDDPDHSGNEDRFIIIGFKSKTQGIGGLSLLSEK